MLNIRFGACGMKQSSPARSDRYINEAFMKIYFHKSKLEWYRGLRLLQEAEFFYDLTQFLRPEGDKNWW